MSEMESQKQTSYKIITRELLADISPRQHNLIAEVLNLVSDRTSHEVLVACVLDNQEALLELDYAESMQDTEYSISLERSLKEITRILETQ